MRIFETRHGQVAPTKCHNNDPSLPVGEVGLTELGKEQALRLGKRLKVLNFHGVIYSSPYERTMATACIVAKEVGARVIPLPCLHEIVSRLENFKGATAEEIAKKYPLAMVDSNMEYPWWGNEIEDLAAVIERVKNGLAPILEAADKSQDILLVGHAATSVALRHLFGVKENRGFHWNCHLSLLYSTEGEGYANDCTHLPLEMQTGNRIIRQDNEVAFAKTVEEIQAFFGSSAGERVLHISDTSSDNYGYYARLIAEVKPNVIIHTGDLADELKVGRIESVRPYWETAISPILSIMQGSGVRVIVVGGNHDLADKLKALAPNIELMERNTVISLGGKKIGLCHELNRLDPNMVADIYLYGHGLTGETRTPNDNERNGRLYFNGVWGASLHVFEEDKHLVIPKTYL